MNESTGDSDEEEVPHARGPEEIGAADMGPQSASTSSFIAGGGTSGHAGAVVAMGGIDVEAAVGRRLDSPPEQRSVASESPESIVPRSPKREASDELEGVASKRVKEEEINNDDGGTEPDKPAAKTAETPQEVKKDAEGDVVLRDLPLASEDASAGFKPEGADTPAGITAAEDKSNEDGEQEQQPGEKKENGKEDAKAKMPAADEEKDGSNEKSL